MTDLQHTIDRAAAALTHSEPRPDVRARVLSAIAGAPRASRIPGRWPLALAAAGAVVVLGAALTIPRWRQAHAEPPVAARVEAHAAPAQTSSAAAHDAVVSVAASASSTAKPRTAKKPAPPEYVSPTPLPVVAVEAIDAPVQIQPAPLSIPQLHRNPITPGLVTATVLDENGSSRDR